MARLTLQIMPSSKTLRAFSAIFPGPGPRQRCTLRESGRRLDSPPPPGGFRKSSEEAFAIAVRSSATLTARNRHPTNSL